jgi:predicted aspartyl protease
MGLHRLPHGNVTDDPNDEARMTKDETTSKRVRHFCIVLALLVIIPSSALGLVKGSQPTQLSGYKAVPVRYGPFNKMIISIRINGQPASLLVDTGSNRVILDADAAQSFGVRPSQRGLRYVRFVRVNGRSLPVAFAQSLTAGSMSFGSVLVTLRNSVRSGTGNSRIDGLLGLDVLARHKAIINCRSRLIFFKVDQSRQGHLGSAASAEKFTRVPLQREENGALTVPSSIHGQPARLLVDTGAFVTTFHEAFLTSLGIASEPTRISARFASGRTRQIRAGKVSDLMLGDFKVPPAKFGVTPLPDLVLRQSRARIGGILGMDTLYNCHAIIDLDGMNLFLK